MSVLITKLAVQATAQGPDGVNGCIFFKVTLPTDLDHATGGRFGLFPAPAPLTEDPPKIYALPLPRAPHPASLLAPAASLLSLTPATSYPPSAGSSSTVTDSDDPKPYLEVSKSRQVYICIDASASSRPRTLKRKDSFGGLSTDGTSSTHKRKQDGRNQAPKREWLVCVPFLAPLLDGYAEGVSAISMHVPRCLNNTLRLRISYPVLSDADEGFDVTTEPKTLMAPTDEASGSAAKGHHLTLRDPNEEGWEDGELPDATNRSLGLDGEEDDDGGESLQGRFPSTSILHIAWSPAASGQSPISHARLNASTSLPPIAAVELTAASIIKVHPVSASFPPSITFHQTLPISLSPSQQARHDLLLRSKVPEGWAWSQLSVTGSGVGEVRSVVSGDIIGGPSRMPEPQLSSSDDEVDDSFATVRGASASKKRQAHKRSSLGPSLLRQSLPVDEVSLDDFSMEMPSSPAAPISATSSRRLFHPVDLITDRDLAVSIVTSSERLVTTVVVQGTLTLISHLHHIMPGSPVELPSWKAVAVQGRQPCHIHLPAALKRVVDLAQERMAQKFSWPGKVEAVAELSEVAVNVKTTNIGTQLVTFTGRWRPDDSSLFEMCMPFDGDLKLLGATIDGTPIRRGLTTRWHDWLGAPKTGCFSVIGLDAQGQFGVLRLLFETSGGGETCDGRVQVPLPVFKNHTARHVTVRIEDAYVTAVETDLTKSVAGQTYSGLTGGIRPSYLSYRTLTPAANASKAVAPVTTASLSKPFKLISFTSFATLIFLYILASVVIEVHHLRRELTTQNQHVEQYFAKQTRTLDGWETRLQEQLAPVTQPSVAVGGSTAVGRLNDHTAFNNWLRHPAVSVAVSGVRRFLTVLRFLLTGCPGLIA